MSFRLRHHLFLYASVLTLLLTTAIIALYTLRFKEHAINSLTDYGKTITISTSFSLADHLFAEEYAPLQEFVQEFSSQINVVAIEISDVKLNTIAASDVEKLGTHMLPDDSSECLDDQEDGLCVRVDAPRQQLVVTAPIVIEDIQLGQVRVYLTTKEVLASVAIIQRQGVLTGFFCWIFAMVFGSLVMHRITKPLRKFVEATEKISRGDFNVELPSAKWVVELDNFAKVLGVMAQAIASREHDLRLSESKFRHLFERAMDGIFVADGRGAILDANQAFIGALGYQSRQEVLALNLFEDIFYDNENLQMFKTQIVENGFVQGVEPDLKKKDNSKIMASLTCHIVKDDTEMVTMYEGLIRDITKRKTADQEIARMRNYLNNIIESMPSTLISVDENSVVTQWNAAAAHQTGIISSQALGQKIWDIAPFMGKYTGHFEKINRDGKSVKLFREQMQHDGERIFNMTLFSLMANGTNGIAILLDDITELEKIEQQLRQAQKMESVGTLAGGIAHDFNNILTAVLGYAEITREALPNDSPLASNIDQVIVAGNRAKELVKQILTFSRQTRHDRRPLQIHLIVKEAIKLLRASIPTTIELRQNIDPKCGFVLAEPSQIHQIVMNLCTNAYHAMLETGGILAVTMLPVKIDEDDPKTRSFNLTPGAYVEFEVSDTGKGMDKETIRKIFEPYFSTKKKGEGTGLGLSVVHSIIKSYNGHVTVYSEPKKGTTFRVYLPQLDSEVVEEEHKITSPYPVGTEKILIVDDEDAIVKIEKQLLESLGYKVFAHTDSHDLLQAFKSAPHDFDLIVTDMTMPKMTGMDLSQQILAIRPDMPIILCTGYSALIDKEKALATGISEYIMKPLIKRDFAEVVRKALDKNE